MPLRNNKHIENLVIEISSPKTTTKAPENEALEKEIAIGNHHLFVPCYVLGMAI